MPLNDLVASPLMADSRRPQPVHRSSGIAVVETTAAFRNRPDGLRKQLGLSCRWLYGAVRQQCAGHLPFKRRETANGGFSVLPTGTTDPEETFAVCRCNACFQEKRTLLSLRVTGESGQRTKPLAR